MRSVTNFVEKSLPNYEQVNLHNYQSSNFQYCLFASISSKDGIKSCVFTGRKVCCETVFLLCNNWANINNCLCKMRKVTSKFDKLKWGKVTQFVFNLVKEIVIIKCNVCGINIPMTSNRLDASCVL